MNLLIIIYLLNSCIFKEKIVYLKTFLNIILYYDGGR